MKTIKTLLTVFFAFLGISSVCLYGADIPFRGLDKSNHISGPEVTQEMMKGKVVLFDYWGLGCPPCHASMPKLEALWQKYGDKYLIIIGSESWKRNRNEIRNFLTSQRITFPIYQGVTYNNVRPRGVPHAVLIDSDGKLVTMAHPARLYAKVAQMCEELKKKQNLTPETADPENNVKKHPFTDLDKSNHISGPEVTPEMMKGKVVLFDYWGLGCPPCHASMPKLEALWKKYNKYLVVIGSESWRKDRKAIREFLTKNRITFPIYQGVTYNNIRPRGVPHAVLLDSNGKLVTMTHPAKLYAKVAQMCEELKSRDPDSKNVPSAALPIEGLDKSNHISGPQVTQEMMKGKVVLFDYWGLGCPPCHASMPKLQALWKKYGNKYLIVIGSESWRKDRKQIKAFLKKNKIKFPIYQGAVYDNIRPRGVPHAILIDENGNLVEKAHPARLYAKVEEMCKALKRKASGR